MAKYDRIEERNQDNHDKTLQQSQLFFESLVLDNLVRLATMNPSEYQESLQQSSHSHYKDSQDNLTLQTSLENVKRDGERLEDISPAAVQFRNAIHSLHSNIHALQNDAEEREQMQDQLRQKLIESQQRASKLERALLRLHFKHQSLRHRMIKMSQENHSLLQRVHTGVRKVQDSQQEQHSLKEQNTVFRLHLHHQFLQQQQKSPLRMQESRNRGRSFSRDVLAAYPQPPSQSPSPSLVTLASTTSKLRVRALSHDTNVSDLDGLGSFGTPGTPCNHSATVDEWSCAGNALAVTASKHFPDREKIHDIMDEEIGLGNAGVGDDHDSEEKSSCYCPAVTNNSVVPSLVTDEGIATLRLCNGIANPESLHSKKNQAINRLW